MEQRQRETNFVEASKRNTSAATPASWPEFAKPRDLKEGFEQKASKETKEGKAGDAIMGNGVGEGQVGTGSVQCRRT
jgi:hypothetical protein